MKKVKLNLVGCDGNSFAVMSKFKEAAQKDGWEMHEITAVINEAISKDDDYFLTTILSYTE